MTFLGVDTLGGLVEKLRQLISDTQTQYENLIDSTQRYKKGKMSDKEYFASVGKYLIAISAMNFLAVKVILELKLALDKGSLIKNPTGELGGINTKNDSQAGFGIGGFIGGGGSAGGYSKDSIIQPLDTVEGSGNNVSNASISKNCIVCGVPIPIKAKFCSKCGNAQ